ncbi:MAG TPA: mitochondrial fission ELM1 family protein [Caulobacteraceae bacterium]
MTPLTCWFMTTGEAGFRSQARGLAERLARDPRELVVGLRFPWNRLPVGLTPDPFALLDPARDRPAPPWPDLLISCGRRTVALAMAIRRASKGRTLAVHVQDPLVRPEGFDLVIAMQHDAVYGPNVLKVVTALHGVTPEKLAEAGGAWRDRLGAGPLAGVLIGGPTGGKAFPTAAFIAALTRLRSEQGVRLVIAPSRRTPPSLVAGVTAAFAGDPGVLIWDRQSDNPYLGILALADRLVVTSDSVSMISEALATGHPVEIFGAPQNARHARFLRTLFDDGLIDPFTGGPAAARDRRPVDATDFAAQAVRRLLEARTGAVL